MFDTEEREWHRRDGDHREELLDAKASVPSSFFEVALFKSENTAHRAHQQTLSTVMAEQLLVVPSVQAF